MESVILSKENLTIVGDSNIHVDVPDDPDAPKFLDFIDSLGLQQHENKPTHIHKHTLDLVISRKTSNLIQNSPALGQFFSDHASVICLLRIQRPIARIKRVMYRKLRSVDMDQLRDDLSLSRLCSVEHTHCSQATDLAHLVDEYQETLSRLIDHHAPIKEKAIRTRSQVPWYNEEIAKAKRERRKAERVWRRSGHKSDFAIFKKKNNHATYIINKARKAYSEFIDSTNEDQGNLFRNMKKLLSVCCSLTMMISNLSLVI